MAESTSPDYKELAERLRVVVDATVAMAQDLRLLFVTNLRTGEFTDLGPEGVLNSAQYYTRSQADTMVRSFQELGATVEPLFSEMEFLKAVIDEAPVADERLRIVYTTAEGGSGSGRRALIPALCNLLHLPVLNSGAHAATLARHKFHAYLIVRQAGVRVPDTWHFDRGRWAGGSAPAKGLKVIVKPTYESMGIGVDDESVRLVDDDFEQFVEAKHRAFGQPAIIQEFITGEEVGVPVARIGSTVALPPIVQRRADGRLYGHLPKTFRDEHLNRDLSHSDLDAPKVQVEEMREAAICAFDALGMQGVGRIDFRIDADGRAWAFDTNGEPPPLPHTCWSEAMGKLGFSLHEMLALWLGICLHDYGLAQDSTQKDSSQQGIRRP